MANEEHLSVLLQGPQRWNEWRDANPEVQPDLRNADLHEAELSGANLSRAILIDADLHQACLKEANLEAANLRRADLRQTNFQRANLHKATLAKTDLRDANLREADVREADLRESRLPGALMEGADLHGAVLNKDGFRYVSMHNDRLKARAQAVAAAGAARAPASLPAIDSLPAPKSGSLKVALAAGVVLLVAGFVGFWVLSPRNGADPAVSQAVSEAIANETGIDSVEIEGQTLILRSRRATVESGMYLNLLKTACQALGRMESGGELRAIRITNRGDDEGWVYSAPEKCGEILTKPAALISLSIAADTEPIRK
jgi:uncharacterized protein YjbI with pentapeptide repeats